MHVINMHLRMREHMKRFSSRHNFLHREIEIHVGRRFRREEKGERKNKGGEEEEVLLLPVTCACTHGEGKKRVR